ncbi:MAG: hypothetical protein VR69_16515 [Peptococcaceae bacterium BRH_c4b]|nr:MAG: hypothetical protein VR69_16515 [Peptococcaceae bacterium BRH_c4b]
MLVSRNRKKHKTEAEMLRYKLKLEIADELGLLEKIKTGGWGALSAVEAGKIGGLLAGRIKDSTNLDAARKLRQLNLQK